MAVWIWWRSIISRMGFVHVGNTGNPWQCEFDGVDNFTHFKPAALIGVDVYVAWCMGQFMYSLVIRIRSPEIVLRSAHRSLNTSMLQHYILWALQNCGLAMWIFRFLTRSLDFRGGIPQRERERVFGQGLDFWLDRNIGTSLSASLWFHR